ncbi:MAG: hypothetical protein WC998_00890 [Candidatus Paceibacterota bacterium]|jgi:hypothetical protein
MAKKKPVLKNPLQEKFEKWDKGQHTFSSAEESIRRIHGGEHFGEKTLKRLRECTICPIGNASCIEFFKITIHGVCPGKPIKTIDITVCPLGCNAETCILNK